MAFDRGYSRDVPRWIWSKAMGAVFYVAHRRGVGRLPHFTSKFLSQGANTFKSDMLHFWTICMLFAAIAEVTRVLSPGSRDLNCFKHFWHSITQIAERCTRENWKPLVVTFARVVTPKIFVAKVCPTWAWMVPRWAITTNDVASNCS